MLDQVENQNVGFLMTRLSYNSLLKSCLAVEQPPQRKVGSITEYDPMNEKFGSIAGQAGQGQRRSKSKERAQRLYNFFHAQLGLA